MKKLISTGWIIYIVLIMGIPTYAQLQVPFSTRYAATLYGDFMSIGNNVLSTTATSNYNGTSGNHNVSTVYVDIDADASTFNSSSADLLNPVSVGCVTVKKVFLYWSAADYPDPGFEPAWNYNQIKLKLPGQVSYATISADNVIYEGRSTNFNNNPYTCFKDITNLVSALGNPFGTYQVANVKAKYGSLSTATGNVGTSGGWQIVFIYEGANDPSGISILPPKYISIFDGFANVTSSQNNYNINISGFQTPPTGPVSGKLMIGALEGDRDLTGDRLQIRNNSNVFVDLSTANRPSDNFFNSRITVGGADFTNRNPASTNTLGFDAGYFTPTTPNIFTNNQTSTAFRLTSNQETYALYLLGFSIDVKGPNFNPLLSTVTPSSVNAGDILTNTFIVRNNGDDDARSVTVTRTIPPELDLVLPISPLPLGVSYTYNAATRLLTFNFVDGILDVGDPSITISYQTTVKPQCYFLETACVKSTSSQLMISFRGVINTSLQSTLSSSSISSCGIGNTNANINNINTPVPAEWATLPNALNRTVNCNDVTALSAAQSLFPSTDKCSFTILKNSGVYIPQNNSCPVKGSYTNTWTFTDKCGRISPIFTQIITVQDTTKPSITGVPANTTVSCASEVPVASISSVTATDGCGGTVTVTVDDALSNQSCANRYTLTRTWTARDACGNSATASQTITVDDQTVPVITNVPSNTTVSCASEVPVASISSVTATDGCGGTVTVTVDDVITNQSCANRYTLTRTWTARDVCGNSATASQTITVDDQTVPVITNVPANTTVSCASEVPVASISSVTATDGCGGTVTVTVDDAISNQSCANRYTLTRTWTARDACGNSATASQTITVDDQTVPVITNVPANTTVSCASEVPVASISSVTATDGCGGTVTVTVDDAISNQSCANKYTLTRTWTARDVCGNSATASQTITVDDQTVPVITNVPSNTTVSCASEVPMAEEDAVTVSDGCGGTVTVTVDDALSNQSCANRYTLTRTWTARDACGNSATASQTITVDDQTVPVITNVPSNTTVSCASLVPVASISSVTATDGCGGTVTVTVDDALSNQSCANRYTLTRTWTARDVCGNSATASQTITVDDQTVPVITNVPANTTVSCASEVPVAEEDAVTVSDGCGGTVTVTVDDAISNQSCANRYTLTRTWTARDACGNSATASQTITVDDQTVPVITNVPANTTVSCASEVPVAEEDAVTVSDGCGGTVTVTVDDAISNQSCANRYTLTRTWTARDACGNSATASQTITVDDQTVPVITNVPANTTVSCASEVPVAEEDAVTATDGCGGTVTVTVDDAISNQSCANRYTLTRTWTARDVCGNSATASQTITVDDQTVPVITNVPSNTTVSCASEVPVASISSVTATDGCGGTVTVTVDDVITNQSCANRYTLTRTWTARDACGNSATASQTISVDDQTVPVITNVPANTTVSCASEVPMAEEDAVTVSDGCGGTVTVTVDDAISNQSCANRYTLTRTWTARDACGNSATASQTITVDDQTVPVITNVPANTTVSCASEVPVAEEDAVTVSDGCGGTVTVTVDDAISNQSCANRYTLTRTWTARDVCGNSATASQTITVDDQTVPVITNVPANTTVSCASEVPMAEEDAVTVSDGCGGTVTVTVDDAISNQSCANRYTLTRTWTARDVCGNSATASQTITVDDQTVPVITNVPANTTVSCASEVPVAEEDAVTVSDGCGGTVTVTVDDAISNQSCANRYTLTRTWTARDVCGNSATASQTITVDDQTVPVITNVPANTTVSCASEVPVAEEDAVTVSDGCGGTVTVTVDDAISNQSCANRYTLTRTWTARDVCGNSATASQTITVDDQTVPVITNVPANTTVSCASEVPMAEEDAVTVSDGCGGTVTVTVDDAISNQSCANRYTLTRTWTARDACGNSATASQTISVDDQTVPVITNVPANTTVSCASEVPMAEEDAVTVSDGCGGTVTVTVDDAISNQSCANRYTLTRTWTARDACGNSATASQTITVDDQTVPVITNVPANTTVSCASEVPVAEEDAVTVSDGCGGTVTVTVDDAISNQSCANKYTLTRTWTARDACGNSATASQTITVDDQTVPVITNVPANTTVSCASEVPVAEEDAVTVSDGCGGTVTVTVDDAISNQSCANRYTLTRTWTARDVCGNSATASQTITVDDQTVPVITNVPANTTVSCASEVPMAEEDAVTVSDGCGGTVTVTVDDAISNQSCANRYTLTRTWTARDACGNNATASQTITVDDQTVPVITNVPANTTVSCASEVPVAEEDAVTVSDGCGGTVTVTVDDAISNQSCANRYTLTRTWTARDACGNNATASQTITVDDQTAPVITNVPANTTVSCASEVPVASISSVTATDGCGGTVTVTVDDAISNQSCANRYTLTRTWTARDVCGNSATASQTITVDDTIKPTFISDLPENISVCDELPISPVLEAFDNCGLDTIYFTEILDTLSGVWQYYRTWEAKDICGNSTSHTQIITLHKTIRNRLQRTICSGDSVLINDLYYFISGNYLDTLSTIFGCDSILDISIDVLSLPEIDLDIKGNRVLCENHNTIILATNSQNGTYQWYKDNLIIEGANDSLLSINKAGIYSVSITSLDGCKKSDTISILASEQCPRNDTFSICIPLRYDSTVCFNEWIQLPTTINNISFCENPKEEVDIAFNSQNGCADIFINAVENFSDSFCVVFCDDISICDTLIVFLCGEKRTLPPIAVDDCIALEKNTENEIDVLLNDYDPDGHFLINSGIIIPPKYGEAYVSQEGKVIYNPIKYFCGKDTLYYKVCDNIDGCDTGLVCISIDCECVYPEVITPNNDGINDNLVIPCIIGVDNAKLVIWNRWGSIIYENDNYKNDWQGTYKGEQLPVGTYWYSIEYYHPDSKEKIQEVRYFMIIK